MIIWENGNGSILFDLIYMINNGNGNGNGNNLYAYECYSAMPRGFIKLTNDCLDNKLMKSKKKFGNIFCASQLLIPGVVLAFDALSYYHIDG